MAFVLVQHLAPDHASILCDLIRRYTRMDVFEVEDGMPVRINCVYIIPPGRDMAFLNGALQLLDPVESRGRRLPIDFFFRSLAQDQHERAIGIVLSGTGSDGTLGVRAIKDGGGMAMAQSPESTEFDGMPRSVIATGLVDYELPPAGMPARLIAYIANASGNAAWSGDVPAPKTVDALKKIFVLLRAQTGHDFSQYKPGTIVRRFQRRMAVHQIETMDGCVKFLQQTPSEVEALFRDLLIGVTHFFRDPEVFQMVEGQVVPKLFAGKPAGGTIRVWSAGCSTGEEAYSLAILLVERMEALRQSYTLQVFATDIDAQAIAAARAGVFPAGIASDVPPERLARFFTAEPGGYRIQKGIRDLIIFSEQNVTKDPPFSKLDLISCRNLMIYLGPDLQRRLIPVFHYALNPGGFLLPGTSEGIGEFDALFDVRDRKMKVYLRKGKFVETQRTNAESFVPPVSAVDAVSRGPAARSAFPVKMPLRELTEHALLQQVVAAAALVQSHGDILYLHGRSGMFLEPASGEAGANNILKMAREGLRQELAVLLGKAVETKETVQAHGLRVKTNSHFTAVNLTIRPVAETAPSDNRLFLVILEEAPPAPPATHGESDERIAALQRELRTKEEYLQSTCEELESSAEEIKSSNEEMQSVNEELETAKEELQSVNEELSTVNTELQTRVNDLSRSNNDMNNLLSGTDITEIVRTREALQKANEMLRLAVVVRDAHDAITVQDLDGRTLAWNPGAVRMYGWSEAEALAMNARDRIPPELRAGALDKLHQLSQAEILKPCLTRRITKAGKSVEVSVISTALLNEAGEMYAVATTERKVEVPSARPLPARFASPTD
jgi:two-component system, chemotaxis family, CheB/CheR fusion protein